MLSRIVFLQPALRPVQGYVWAPDLRIHVLNKGGNQNDLVAGVIA
jgi:hypothetical protein